MSPFQLYLPLGFKHIADLSAYDHLLFLVALCGMYSLKNWKHLLGLISAFSLGHTLTLTLSAFQIIRPNVEVVELLIPITILLTAIGNVANLDNRRMLPSQMSMKYVLTALFGLIHGMGFSNYFGFLITGETNIVRPLVYFTLGIELGQIVIVGVILLLARLMKTLFFFKSYDWNLFLSGIAAGISLLLVIEKSAFLFADPLTVTVVQTQAPLCAEMSNGSAEVQVQGGFPDYRYYWSSGQNSAVANNLTAGSYTVTVEDARRNVATATATVAPPNPFSVNIAQDSLPANGRWGIRANIQGGKPEYRYVWSDGQTTEFARNLFPGVYGLTVTDANGCTASAETKIGR